MPKPALPHAAALLAAAAAALATPAAAKVDFSGYWILKTDPATVPKAATTPAAAKRVAELLSARGLDAPKGSPEYARIWCTPEGLPWALTHSLPIDIRQGPLTVTTTFTGEWDSSHIYIDGQPHPDMSAFDATTVGHSVGRWRGDSLVADTVGFGEGVLVLPGEGLRSEKSRLTETWRLVGKDRLRITHTWTDPTTLRRPHTYTFEWERAKGPVWVVEGQCNNLRAMRAKGLPLPPDAPQG